LYFQLRQLSAQVRQTEKNQQALIKQGRTDRSANANANFAANPSYFEAHLRVATCSDSVTPVDCLRVGAFMLSAFQNAEESYSQYRRGLLDKRDFDSVVTHTTQQLRSPVVRAGWKRFSDFFYARFR